jgi:single-strand DNA-binding protein
MAGYNRIVLVGNLTRDPDYKQLSSGQPVCRLGLATNRQFKNRQTGNLVQEVCYIDVDVWGVQAESCRQYLQKGRSVLIEGRLKLDSWEDQAGQTRSKHSVVADRVVFLGSGAGANDIEGLENSGYEQPGKKQEPQSALERDLLSQIDQIKGRAVKSAEPVRRVRPAEQSKSAPQSAMQEQFIGGEMNFKDEPPFEDDLPF